MLSWVSFLICHRYCSGTWASHLRSLWKWEKREERCFLCFLFLWLSVWIVHFFRARAESSISLQLFFANCSGLTNKALGKCEAEKEKEEEHNYDYVDENIIENIRKVFQDTTVRNKHALSEGRRWVWSVIAYGCEQVQADWPVIFTPQNEGGFPLGAAAVAPNVLWITQERHLWAATCDTLSHSAMSPLSKWYLLSAWW